MKVTIHQPEHFPYMGFFQKITKCDIYVVLDNVKYRKNYFQNRNFIRDINGNDQWLTVPVKGNSNSCLIKDVETVDTFEWREKIIKIINKNFAFNATEIYKYDKLIDINLAALDYAYDRLKIKKPKTILASSLKAMGSKSELLANIVKEVGGTQYISGPSGKEYLDISLFDCEVVFSIPDNCDKYSCLNHFK